MHVSLSITELVSLVVAKQPLPPYVQGVRGEGNAVYLRVDVGSVPGVPWWAAAAAGVADIAVVVLGYDDGVATLEVDANVRGLSVDRLLPMFADRIDAELRKAGLPGGLVTVRRAPGGTVLDVRVQDAIATRARGLVLTGLALRDAVLQADVEVGPPGQVSLP